MRSCTSVTFSRIDGVPHSDVRHEDEKAVSLPVDRACARCGSGGLGQVCIESRKAALNFRDELLAQNWADAVGVAELGGQTLTPEKAEAYASSLRARGQLLGVWAEPHHAFVYPSFQFDDSGQVRPTVAILLSSLPMDDPGGWRRAFWLYSPHTELMGKTPADIFVVDPLLVVDLAEREFIRSQNDCW